jgi:hypothetical protein
MAEAAARYRVEPEGRSSTSTTASACLGMSPSARAALAL